MELQAKVYTRTKDNGGHYARIITPKDLRAFVSKPALWRTLATKNNKEAIIAGTLVAAAAQLVFQEVSDEYADAAVVKVTAEIASKDIDLAKFLDKIDSEDLAIMVASLKKSLGLKNGGTGGDEGGGKVNSKKGGKSASERKSTQGAQKSVSIRRQLSDREVAHYLERRPHGIYRFRFWIPRSLQRTFGQREVRKTLKTAERVEAIAIARPLLESVYRRVGELNAAEGVG